MLTNILVLLAIGGLFFFMMRKGGGCCGGGHGSHDNHEGPEAEHDQHMEQKTATATEKDPVCAMTVAPGGPETEHNGRVYHFCSDRCRNIFEQQPEKYA